MSITLKKITAVTAASILAVGLGSSMANAATSKAGSKCQLSGVVQVEKNKAQLCTLNSNNKLTWSKTWKTEKTTLQSSDTWAKTAKEGMSAAFGEISNNKNKEITIIGAKSPYSKAVQLHEVVMKDGAMVMQEKKGGFTIKKGETLELKPGGNHLMFIGLTKAIEPGTMVPITLYTSDGGQIRMSFMAKNFSGANEDYPEGGMGDGGMHEGGMGDGVMGK